MANEARILGPGDDRYKLSEMGHINPINGKSITGVITLHRSFLFVTGRGPPSNINICMKTKPIKPTGGMLNRYLPHLVFHVFLFLISLPGRVNSKTHFSPQNFGVEKKTKFPEKKG